ncbi:MAG: ion channel [Acidimicrobiia bacterium]|nr:ion channel [Acidimicrobiia bacterium]
MIDRLRGGGAEPQSLDFVVAALLLGAVYVAAEVADTTRAGRMLTGVLVYAAALVLLRGVRASRTTMQVAFVLITLAVGLRIVSAANDVEALRLAVSVLHVGIAGAAPFLVLRFIFRAGTVTLNVVFAGITLYLLVGVLFGIVYTDLAWAVPGVFEPAQEVATTGDSRLFYFSFVTLTTVGFGDIAPASDLTRSLVVLEALIGQVVLVVLIARLVGSVESRRA